MKYRVKFTAGSLSGRDFGFTKNTIAIGRSRQNDVVLTEPDVSARHVVLYLTPQGVEMENLSSRITVLDSEPMKLGDRRKLVAGMSVRLGDDVSWELEAVEDGGAAPDDQPTGSFPADDAKTGFSGDDAKTGFSGDDAKTGFAGDDAKTGLADDVKTDAVSPEKAPAIPPAVPAPEPAPAKVSPEKGEEKPAEGPAEDQTVIMQTRLASPEELEYLKVSHAKAQKKKIGLLLFALVAVVAMLFLVYRFFVYREPEEFVTWPEKSNGEMYLGLAKFKDAPFAKDCDIEYPATPGAKVLNDKGRVTIIAAIGKYRDVPLRIVVEYTNRLKKDRTADEPKSPKKDDEPELLKMGRTAIFKDWIAAKSTDEGSWNFDPIQPMDFFATDHGIPFLQATYSRTVKSDAYFGVAVFWRHEDWCFFMTKEVPMRERWRAESFLRNRKILWFSNGYLENHWEGSDNLLPGSAAANLDEAKALLSQGSPLVWKECELLLNSALIKSCETDGNKSRRTADKETYRFALAQLCELRKQQRKWFNAQKIAYFCAKNAKQEKEQKRISESVKAVFSSNDDLRYYKIRRDQWD